jgi:hypothetical protein
MSGSSVTCTKISICYEKFEQHVLEVLQARLEDAGMGARDLAMATYDIADLYVQTGNPRRLGDASR